LIRPRWARQARNMIGQTLMGIPPLAAVVAGTISGIGIRYPAPPGADRRVGTRMPNIPLTGGRLHDALRGGRFVLVGTGATGVVLPVHVDAAVPAQSTGELVLVRPDGYLAWVGTASEFTSWARQYFSGSSQPVEQPDFSGSS
ncbi:MAG: hypothetical protein M3300_02365, partial [Actinomycetota bacterium]|nr:hypothetical protein [Actinomycetota bacterium]